MSLVQRDSGRRLVSRRPLFFAMPYTIKTVTFPLPIGSIADQQQVLMPDSRRVSIIFNFGVTTTAYVSNREMAGPEDSVLATSNTLPIIVLYKDFADLVRREWWAYGVTGLSFVTVTEVLHIS